MLGFQLEALYGGGDPFSSQGTAPEVQNGGSGFQKFADAAQNLPKPINPAESNIEPQVAPDIAEMARQIENGDKMPPF